MIMNRPYTTTILGLNYFLEFADKLPVGQRESTFIHHIFSNLSFSIFNDNNIVRSKYNPSFLIRLENHMIPEKLKKNPRLFLVTDKWGKKKGR